MANTILIIANATNTHTHRFIREFKQRGWQVYILSIQPPNKKNIKEFGNSLIQLPANRIYRFLIKRPLFKYSEFHNISSGVKWYEPYSIAALFNYFYLLFSIKNIVKKINPDGIFSIYLTMNGFLAALSGHKIIVSSAAGADVSIHKLFSLKYWVNHPAILRFATKNSYKVLGFDKNTFEPLFKKKKCGVENIVWMEHWGVETDKFTPSKIRFNSKNTLCKLVCSRPYRTQFDFESILIAVKEIYKNNKNVQFIIASGAQSKKNLAHLRKTLHKTGCSDTEFIKILNYINYKELPNLLQQCDVYIDPVNINKYPETIGWGVSGSLLEAMSCGLIPVISRRPGIDWILPTETEPFVYDDFQNGLLTALTNAVKSKNDTGVRMAMRNAVLEKANWRMKLDNIEKFFSSKIRDV
jgi:glycosyltransferase involved in cell wall biosynthesis